MVLEVWLQLFILGAVPHKTDFYEEKFALFSPNWLLGGKICVISPNGILGAAKICINMVLGVCVQVSALLTSNNENGACHHVYYAAAIKHTMWAVAND